MAKVVTCVFVISSLILWYFLLFARNGVGDGSGGGEGNAFGFGVAATNGHGSPLEGRDRHHMERSGHIRSKCSVVGSAKCRF